MKARAQVDTPLPELGLTHPTTAARIAFLADAATNGQKDSDEAGTRQPSADEHATVEAPCTSASVGQAPRPEADSSVLPDRHPSFQAEISMHTYITYENMLGSFDKAAQKW